MKKLLTTVSCIAAIATSSMAQTIVIDSLQGSNNFGMSPATSYCKGAAFNVYVTVNGFSAGTVFTAQLSGAKGTFSPIVKNIGTASASTGNGSLVIPVQIPVVQGIGTNFRIRVITSSPSVVSAPNSVPLTILQRPAGFETNLTPLGAQVKICDANTVTIATVPNAAYTYQWMKDNDTIPGATTHSYTTGDSGIYNVLVTTSFGCLRSSGNRKVMVYPTPVATFTVSTLASGAKRLSGTQTGTGVSYQWQLNGSNISGATSRYYTPTTSGNYNAVVNRYGCQTVGAAQFVSVGTARETNLAIQESETPVLIYPNPSVAGAKMLISSTDDEQFTVRVYDISGRIVSTQLVASGVEATFGETLPTGMYTVEAVSGTQRFVNRWVKQ